jgi:hypothetical protein
MNIVLIKRHLFILLHLAASPLAKHGGCEYMATFFVCLLVPAYDLFTNLDAQVQSEPYAWRISAIATNLQPL